MWGRRFRQALSPANARRKRLPSTDCQSVLPKKPVTDAAAPDGIGRQSPVGTNHNNCNMQLIYCNMRLMSSIESTLFSGTFVV